MARTASKKVSRKASPKKAAVKTTAKASTKAKTNGKRANEADLRKKYSHVVVGSLAFQESGKYKGKQTASIRCTKRGCSVEREVATSDLFQVSFCPEHQAEARAQKRAQKRAASKAEAAAEVAALSSHS